MYKIQKGEKISIKGKALILLIVLSLFFMIGAASAVNETDVDIQGETLNEIPQEETLLEESSQEIISDNSTNIQTTIKSDDTNIVKGKYFEVQLTDVNSTPIANKSVQFTFNDKITNATTNSHGIAKLKIKADPGTYKVKYSFSADGYTSCKNSTKIFVISSSASKIKASDYVAYEGFTNKLTVTLTAGSTPLANRVITFKINGKTITKKTNSKGKATININESKGSYKLKYSYAGEDNINSTSGSVKVTVKKGMPTKLTKYKSKIYTQNKAGYFYVKLVDDRGNLLKSKKIKFTVNGKTYTAKTNKKGIAKVKIKLDVGSYKLKATFAKTSLYNKASKTYTIKVRSAHTRNNGMWLFGRDMYNTDLDKLEKYGINQVFLNFKALELYGKSKVEKWVKQAKSHGIKVHLWMQVFYSHGGWRLPIKNGNIDTKFIDTKVKEAKKYAKIKGIAGVHFDYVRFPGNAHNYKNGVKAVNTFVKKASNAIHKINKKLIVSAALMPEPSGLKYYYGQDVGTISKYLDVLLPMVYKGNYHAGQNWIKSVTSILAKQSKKAKVWTGLQSYRSDESLNKIPAKELFGDARAAASGGAYGVILFRFGLFNYINFNEV